MENLHLSHGINEKKKHFFLMFIFFRFILLCSNRMSVTLFSLVFLLQSKLKFKMNEKNGIFSLIRRIDISQVAKNIILLILMYYYSRLTANSLMLVIQTNIMCLNLPHSVYTRMKSTNK